MKATMSYLQENVDEVRQDLIQLNQEALFLNVKDPNRGIWEWASASVLIFNAPDGEGFTAVRSFLKPYEKLILAAGGSKVERVRPAPLPPSAPEEMLAAIRTSFEALRQSHTLTDVAFVSGSGDEHHAHRAFLVAAGPYFKSMFSDSGMSECRSAGSEDPVRVVMPQSFGSNSIRYTLGETSRAYQGRARHPLLT